MRASIQRRAFLISPSVGSVFGRSEKENSPQKEESLQRRATSSTKKRHFSSPFQRRKGISIPSAQIPACKREEKTARQSWSAERKSSPSPILSSIPQSAEMRFENFLSWGCIANRNRSSLPKVRVRCKTNAKAAASFSGEGARKESKIFLPFLF